MAQVDTSIYKSYFGPSVSQGLSSLADGLQSFKQNKLSNLAMRQQEFDLEQARIKAEREEEDRLRAEAERKRQEAQRDEFNALYQTQQMESGTDQLTPEQMQSVYTQAYPQEYAEQQVKNALSRDPYAGRRLDILESEHKRKSAKDVASISSLNKKQQLEREKFYFSGQKSKEQIRQFEESLNMRREEIALELDKPDRERAFAQEGYRLQLPEYLQSKAKPTKVFTQTEVTKLKDANNSYGDIYKKINDLQSLVPTSSAFISAKGTGETAALVKSQVAQIITDYNRNIAELGALAGQDLTILEEAIPSPSQWKAMTFSTWKNTMKNIEKNIKEKYQGLMMNSDINVSGNLLDTIANRARVTTLTDEENSWITKPSGGK